MKIAICGKMCSGKSTLANHIMRHFDGYQIYSFGQKVKELCVELFNMKHKDRTLLINFANKMREIDPDVWINQVLRETKDKNNCIIDDVRYQNEVDALIHDGWKIIQLHIPYEIQTKRIKQVYQEHYVDHLKNRYHVSEKNNFIFPEGYPNLKLDTSDHNMEQIKHNINMFILKQ
jgi:cytidylate kinase